MINGQKDMTILTCILRCILCLVGHIPVSKSCGDRMVTVGNMHMKPLVVVEAETAIINAADIGEFLPPWKGQDDVMEYNQSLPTDLRLTGLVKILIICQVVVSSDRLAKSDGMT